jgi:vitamin B12 transporter
MYPRCSWAAGAVALVAALPALAVEADAESETIVVTATRQPMRANELLSDVTLIDRDAIEASGQASIADLLARQPGIQMSSSGGPGTSTNFYVRGARPEQTKVLVDGVPLNSVDLSGSPLRFLSLADVERIEILRGPASALYGADAIGGVIQIFTRNGAPGLKADVFAGYGTYNTWQANAGLSGGNEQWRFRIEGNHQASDGFSAQKHAANKDADKDGYRNSGGGASLSFLPSMGHELGLKFRQNAGSTHYDSGNKPADGNFDDRVDFETQQWQVFARNRLSDVWTSKLLYGETVDDQKSYASWAPDGDHLRTKNRQASWQNDVRLPLGTALFALERLEQTASPEESYGASPEQRTDSLIAGWTANHGKHRWQLSARHDDHSEFGDQQTYALAYGYQLTDALRAQASYGTAFKAPSLYQLFSSWYGNANLQPEAAKNREAALVWERGNHTASATWYLNKVENLIDYSFSSNTYENISSSRLEGVTLAYAGQFGDWSVRAAYDWLDARNEDTDQRLGRRARDKATLAVTRHWGAWDAGGEWVGVGPRYSTNTETDEMGGYGLVNLTARYAINGELSLEGRINNLFDKNYETVSGYNTPGFNAFVGLRFQPK